MYIYSGHKHVIIVISIITILDDHILLFVFFFLTVQSFTCKGFFFVLRKDPCIYQKHCWFVFAEGLVGFVGRCWNRGLLRRKENSKDVMRKEERLLCRPFHAASLLREFAWGCVSAALESSNQAKSNCSAEGLTSFMRP